MTDMKALSIIEINTGNEKVARHELKVADYYVNYMKCPLDYKPANKNSERFGNVQKMNLVSKTTGKALSRVDGRGPWHLDTKHHVSQYRERLNAQWYTNIYNVPNNVVIKIEVMEHNFSMGGKMNFATLFFRARDTGPLLQLGYTKAHGLDFIIKGRMDLLPPDYIVKNNMNSYMAELTRIDPVMYNGFLEIIPLMPALIDLEKANNQEVTLGGEKVVIPQVKKLRKILTH